MERPTREWDPDRYLELMAEEVPDYERLQDEVVGAAAEGTAAAILDLGVGIDADASMLAAAADKLDCERTTLHLRCLEDPLPGGPFDLVVSMLAMHHLDAAGKADLLRRVNDVLAPGGRLVLGDLVVPVDAADVVTAIDGVIDTPDSLADHERWCGEAGLAVAIRWRHRDLVVLTARAV